MEVIDIPSSSNELSSAPSSDNEISFISRPSSAHHSRIGNTIVVAQNRGPFSTSASASTSNVLGGAATKPQAAGGQETTKIKQRKPRKKKEADPNAPAEKEKKPRKPRAAPGTSAAARKKQKLEQTGGSNLSQHVAISSDLSNSRLVQPASFVAEQRHVTNPTSHPPVDTVSSGASNQETHIKSQSLSPVASRYMTAPPPQASMKRSTPAFDPVRSIANERNSEIQAQQSLASMQIRTPPRPLQQKTLSPSISSIINHEPVRLSHHATSTSPMLAEHLDGSSDVKPATAPTTVARVDQLVNRSSAGGKAARPEKTAVEKAGTEESTGEKNLTEAEPKPKRVKEQAPLPFLGSGLLSATLFGRESVADDKTGNDKGPNIVIHINLQDPSNKVVNFARLAENKYGFAALYPRQAAQKERLARVAAVGAAMERSASSSKRGGTSGGDSGDEDLSVDIDRDSDNDGDVVMTGVNAGAENSGTDGAVPKKTRKRRDEYDADDPFVDDSEMLWDAQAAASKDGFFVYNGPLVPEGEKPAVERADGTVPRGRGRGRGGGPGSRGGRRGGAAAAAAGASEGSTRGGGPGPRGGGVTRKPRITKAERAQRELEKKQREQPTLLAARPTAQTA